MLRGSAQPLTNPRRCSSIFREFPMPCAVKEDYFENPGLPNGLEMGHKRLTTRLVLLGSDQNLQVSSEATYGTATRECDEAASG